MENEQLPSSPFQGHAIMRGWELNGTGPLKAVCNLSFLTRRGVLEACSIPEVLAHQMQPVLVPEQNWNVIFNLLLSLVVRGYALILQRVNKINNKVKRIFLLKTITPNMRWVKKQTVDAGSTQTT